MGAPAPPRTLAELRAGGKAALASALTGLELSRHKAEMTRLLDEAWGAQKGAAIGFTGPPGVGKSSLIHKLIGVWRGRGRTVGVLAVDPSSHLTGGALLGDRTRMKLDPADQGVFMRSMAARDRLGGLSDLAFPAAVLMRAVYDIVLIETVGVGQSETDIVGVADLTVFCVQPGAGDSLQYMKAGIAEIPDCVIVTKADLKTLAGRALADVRGALGLSSGAAASVPVLAVSAQEGRGLEEAVDWLETETAGREGKGLLAALRRGQALAWIEGAVRAAFGREGVKAAGLRASEAEASAPFRAEADLIGRLSISIK